MSQKARSITYHALTDDGWKIALHRYVRRTDRKPVLLVHGLASNRHNMDFPIKGLSLAQHLWEEGWDTWVIELRGAGKSSRPSGFQWRKGWNADQYVLHDLPTAIRFILEKTSQTQLHWIGHSLGGLLIPPFINTHSADVLRSVVMAASPLTGIPEKFFKWINLTDPFLRFLPMIPNKILAKIIGLRPNLMKWGPFAPLYIKENMDDQTIRMGAKVALDDLPATLVRQFHRWMREPRFQSPETKIRYFMDFKKMKVPILMIAGSNDPFTRASELRKVYDKVGTRKKMLVVFGKDYGHACDYSHWDIILGRHARREVYPLITHWLAKHD